MVADLFARPPRGTFLCIRVRIATRQKRALSSVGPSVWNGLLYRGTFPFLFINSSRLSSLAERGLRAPLSSYLEGALYKLIYTDRSNHIHVHNERSTYSYINVSNPEQWMITSFTSGYHQM